MKTNISRIPSPTTRTIGHTDRISSTDESPQRFVKSIETETLSKRLKHRKNSSRDAFQRFPKIRVCRLFGIGYIDSGIRNGRSDRSFGPPNKRGAREGEQSRNGIDFPGGRSAREYKSRVRKGGTRTWHNESEEIPGIGIYNGSRRRAGKRKM